MWESARHRWLPTTVAAHAMLIIAASAWPEQPVNPVIGAFTNPLEECPYAVPTNLPFAPTHCAEVYNTLWLTQFGVRVVPFAWNLTDAEQDALLDKVNGVVIPGGGINRPSKAFNAYYDRLSSLVRNIWRRNEAGDHVFLWATCYGFELTLSALSSGGLNVLSFGFQGMEPAMLPVTVEAKRARVLDGLDSVLMSALQTENTTLNWHMVGIAPNVSDVLLHERFTTVGVSREPVAPHRSFISLVEARDPKINVFASQFHPSRVPYEFANDAIGHTRNDVLLSKHFGRIVAHGLRRNNHSFPSPQAVNEATVDNFPRVYAGWGVAWFWFP